MRVDIRPLVLASALALSTACVKTRQPEPHEAPVVPTGAAGQVWFGAPVEDDGVRFETIALTRGSLDAPRGAAAPWSGSRLEIDHGWAREHIVRRLGSVEQSWELDRAPPGEGDLVVRVAALGAEDVRLEADGIHFHAGGREIRYGSATWIDAAGRRERVPARWEERAIVMRVPESVLHASRYPAVLDPIVSAEVDPYRRVDTVPIDGVPNDPADFYGSGWMTTYGPVRTPAGDRTYAVRVDLEGRPIDRYGIELPFALGPFSTACTTGTCLVVGRGRAVRIDSGGRVLDAIAPAWAAGEDVEHVRTVATASRVVIVWQRRFAPALRSTWVDWTGAVGPVTTLGIDASRAGFALASDTRTVFALVRSPTGSLALHALGDLGVLTGAPVVVDPSLDAGSGVDLAWNGTQYELGWTERDGAYHALATARGDVVSGSPTRLFPVTESSYTPASLRVACTSAHCAVQSTLSRALAMRAVGGSTWTYRDVRGVLHPGAEAWLGRDTYRVARIAADGSAPDHQLLLRSNDTAMDGLSTGGGVTMLLGGDGTPGATPFSEAPRRLQLLDSSGRPDGPTMSVFGLRGAFVTMAGGPTHHLVLAGSVYSLIDVATLTASEPRSVSRVDLATWGGTGFLLSGRTPDGPLFTQLLAIPPAVGVDYREAIPALPGSGHGIAFDGTNHLVVLSVRAAGGAHLRAWRLRPDGAVREASSFYVTPATTAWDEWPVVAFGGGQYLVAWLQGASRVLVKRVRTDRTVVDADPIVVRSGTTPRDLRVAWNGRSFLVAWREGGTVRAARVSPAGAVLEPEGNVVGPDGVPHLVSPAADAWLLGWTRFVPEAPYRASRARIVSVGERSAGEACTEDSVCASNRCVSGACCEEPCPIPRPDAGAPAMDAGPDAGTSPEAPPPPVPLGTARPLPACSSAVYADGAYLIGRHPAMWLDSTGRIMGGPLDRDVGGVFDGRDLILGSPSGGFLRVRTDLTTRDGWSPLHPRTPGGSGDPDDWTEESLEHIECGGRRCALITRYTDRSYLRFDYDLRRRVFDMSDPPREIASESVLRSSWNEGTGTWMNRTLYFAGDVAGGALVSYEEGLLAPAFTEWDVDLAGSATVNRGDVLEDMPVIECASATECVRMWTERVNGSAPPAVAGLPLRIDAPAVRVIFDGRRYLVIWNPPGSGMIHGLYLTRTGALDTATPFRLFEGSPSALATDGAERVLVTYFRHGECFGRMINVAPDTSPAPDAGPPDGGPPDGGPPDGGPPDADTADAAMTVSDAGTADAAIEDAGPLADAGAEIDAGPVATDAGAADAGVAALDAGRPDGGRRDGGRRRPGDGDGDGFCGVSHGSTSPHAAALLLMALLILARRRLGRP